MNNIFVYIELENGAVADVSLELLTKGRELADELGVKLEAVVLGLSLIHICNDAYAPSPHRTHDRDGRGAVPARS